MKECKTKIEVIKNVFCPECLIGKQDSKLSLICNLCGGEIVEKEINIICGGGVHYHKKCLNRWLNE